MPGRKKYGYLLLLFLVLSGLAGKPTNNSLTKKERVSAAEFLKSTRADLLETIKGLTSKQLEYRKTKGSPSIKDYIYHIVYSDKKLRSILDNGMKSAANPEKRSEIMITDEQLINTMNDPNSAGKFMELFKPEKNLYKSMQQALLEFKSSRLDHIKYIKATSEDLRNHIIATPLGWLDSYQVCLLISAQTNSLTRQLKMIMYQPGFPE